jgi:hypothetical protein
MKPLYNFFFTLSHTDAMNNEKPIKTYRWEKVVLFYFNHVFNNSLV